MGKSVRYDIQIYPLFQEVITMQDIISLITNLGFPIFVSVYLMAELSTKMGKLDSSIQKLSGEIALLKEVLRSGVEAEGKN
jgi:hypothetical protein